MTEIEPNQTIRIDAWDHSFNPPVPDRLWIVSWDRGLTWYEPLGQMVQNIVYLHRDGTWNPSCGDEPTWEGYHESKEAAEAVLKKSYPQWLWVKYEQSLRGHNSSCYDVAGVQ